MHYEEHPYSSKVGDPWMNNDTVKHYNVSCLPFYSILMAMNVNKIDYWSLDVESQELAVLRTFPFDQVYIKVCKLAGYKNIIITLSCCPIS